MNSLSWMLYFAGVAGNVQTLLGVVGGVTLLGSTILGIIGAVEEEPAAVSYGRKGALFVGLPMALLATAIPGENTIYAIAASEMGEQALKTPTAGKAFKALDAWLDRQITPEPSK